MIRCSLCKGYDVNRTTCKMYYVVIKSQSTRESVCVCVCVLRLAEMAFFKKMPNKLLRGTKKPINETKKKGADLTICRVF